MNGHISRAPGLILIAAATLAINVSDVRAQENSDFVKRCASWIDRKGYSRDYVEQRTGSRPPPRKAWANNIRPDELQVGDVVAVTLYPGHVGLIEEIVRNSAGKPEPLKIKSFNYAQKQGWLDRSCEATVNFGIEVTTWVSLDETVGYWRPPSRKN